MKRLCIKFLIFMATLIFYSAAHSTSIPNTDDPKTFLGPTARVGFTSTLNNYTAYNIAGEAGIKNFRLGGTLGWKLTENQWLKISGEYLWQKITYAFFSGNTDKWVDQGALGAGYQYDFLNYSYQPQFGLNAYVSHAPNKSLSTVTGKFTNAQGSLVPFTDIRRIAGSNAAGIAPGVAIAPWQGGKVSAALNYDNVRYDNRNGPNEDAIGVGGTIGLNQAITDNLGLALSAAWRQPFNNYAANLSWSNVHYYGIWSLGLFGDYTIGKNTLPDTYNVGLSANYFLDQRCQTVPANLKGEDLKGEATTTAPIRDNLLAWTADPAVYMPQVLAIVDEKVTTDPCAEQGITVTNSFSNLTIPNGTTTETIDAISHFSGNGLTYSVSTSGTVTPNSVSITPQGELTINAVHTIARTFTVNVTASNSCNTASSSFTVTVVEEPST